jgi:hypothetical protein
MRFENLKLEEARVPVLSDNKYGQKETDWLHRVFGPTEIDNDNKLDIQTRALANCIG